MPKWQKFKMKWQRFLAVKNGFIDLCGGTYPDLTVIDSTPISLGIKSSGEMNTIVPR